MLPADQPEGRWRAYSYEDIVARVRECAQAEGGDADVIEAIYRSLMEVCIAYEHREFARLREPATAGSAA